MLISPAISLWRPRVPGASAPAPLEVLSHGFTTSGSSAVTSYTLTSAFTPPSDCDGVLIAVQSRTNGASTVYPSVSCTFGGQAVTPLVDFYPKSAVGDNQFMAWVGLLRGSWNGSTAQTMVFNQGANQRGLYTNVLYLRGTTPTTGLGGSDTERLALPTVDLAATFQDDDSLMYLISAMGAGSLPDVVSYSPADLTVTRNGTGSTALIRCLAGYKEAPGAGPQAAQVNYSAGSQTGGVLLELRRSIPA